MEERDRRLTEAFVATLELCEHLLERLPSTALLLRIRSIAAQKLAVHRFPLKAAVGGKMDALILTAGECVELVYSALIPPD